ncbi:hypothetical protein G159_14640 [Planococcus glaciei CHR43]|nr:hypothetical protein G159_14640 [Planococcus glaciei CHR43]
MRRHLIDSHLRLLILKEKGLLRRCLIDFRGRKIRSYFRTERLIMRPLRKQDYQEWLRGFEQRAHSQNRHDQGKIDMSECTQDWFEDLVNKHQKLTIKDIAHIFIIIHR